MSAQEEELYSAVEEALESKGVLGTIRAQLRAAVLEAVMEADPAPPRDRVRVVPHGELALDLVTDFLSRCELRRALCVLMPEAGAAPVDSRKLRERLGLAPGDGPVLCDLLATKGDDDDFSAHLDSVEGPHVLDDEGDVVEAVDTDF